MESGCLGLMCEVLAALLAQDLGIPVPEPFLVHLESDLHLCAPDPDTAQRLKDSAGLNYGSRFLGPGFSEWPRGRSVPRSLLSTAADIFAFDVLVQNPDRRPEKPNCLHKSDQLFALDHELAFSFLHAIGPAQLPWKAEGLEYTRRHVFYDPLKGRAISLERFRGALEALSDERLQTLAESVPQDWQNSGNALERIVDYMKEARRNSTALTQIVEGILQ
ncbi:MAG: hypothetical protein NTW86_28085 [Candidatus Sumerlaeota bacterium]|nr:hypothetical protein [Candidatus Sumerlaeota bacterium]